MRMATASPITPAAPALPKALRLIEPVMVKPASSCCCSAPCRSCSA
jgi:hypothetical protein